MTPEVTTMLVGGFAALLLAVFGFLGDLIRRKLNTVKGHTEASREQVENSHTTNLRDDIDLILAGLTEVKTTLGDHSRELEGIRNDLRQERVERIAGDKATIAATAAVNAHQH